VLGEVIGDLSFFSQFSIKDVSPTTKIVLN